MPSGNLNNIVPSIDYFLFNVNCMAATGEEVENRILRKVFKNPQLTVEKSSSVDRSIVEMTFAVKTEPNDEEMESNPLQQTTSNLQHSAVTLENYTLDYFINSSALPQASQVSVSHSSEVTLPPRMQANTELQSKMKNTFYANLFSKDSKHNSALMTKQKYDSIIKDVKRIKVSKRKESSRDYRIIERYDVLIIKGCERLIEPLSDTRKSIKMFVYAEELFDILYSTHLSAGHGGRDRMIKPLNKLYKNITRAQIKLFLDLCKSCQKRREKKGIFVKPIV